MSDSEERRPRAQYGEFATPEEQQRARGIPEQPSEADAAAPAAQAGYAASATPAGPAPAAREAAPAAWPTDEPRSKHPHPVDRVVTLILLAIGLFILLNG